MTRVILLGGYPTSGKDTVADLVSEIDSKRKWKTVQMSSSIWDILLSLDPYVDGETRRSSRDNNFYIAEIFRLYEAMDSDPFSLDEWNSLWRTSKRAILKALDPYLDGRIRLSDLARFKTVTECKQIPEVRRLFTALGTDACRNLISEEVWTQEAQKKVLDLLENEYSVCVTGIRFPDQLHGLKSLDEKVLTLWVEREVSRPNLSQSHSSNTSLSYRDFSLSLDNNKGIEELRRTVSQFVSTIDL